MNVSRHTQNWDKGVMYKVSQFKIFRIFARFLVCPKPILLALGQIIPPASLFIHILHP